MATIALTLWKIDPKTTAVAGCRLHPQLPIHSFHALLDDGKTDPGARIFVRWMQSLKHSEHFRLVFWGYSDAVIFDVGTDKFTQVLC